MTNSATDKGLIRVVKLQGYSKGLRLKPDAAQALIQLSASRRSAQTGALLGPGLRFHNYPYGTLIGLGRGTILMHREPSCFGARRPFR